MKHDAILVKILLAVAPAMLVIPISLGFEMLLGTATPLIRAMAYPLLGALGAALLYRLTTFVSERTGLGKPFLGNIKGVAAGIAIGLLVSFSSAGLYRAVFGGPSSIEPHFFFEKLGIRVWGNLGPAILEEVGFRGGLVFFANSFWGLASACVGGSVPFGLAHLASGFLGQPVGLVRVLGTTMAGLLLTAIYLRYGLVACIACHWVWNALCGSWTKVLQIQGKWPAQVFEGAWTTIVVLAIASAIILWRIVHEGGKVAGQESA